MVIVIIIVLSIDLGVNTMPGAQCAMFPELFGAPHRYIGAAVSREFSAVVAGGLGPVVGALVLDVTNDAVDDTPAEVDARPARIGRHDQVWAPLADASQAR